MNELLKYHDILNELVHSTFGKHSLFRQAFDQACRSFMNLKSQTPELLAIYCNQLLINNNNNLISLENNDKKENLYNLSDSDIEKKLDGVATIFRFIGFFFFFSFIYFFMYFYFYKIKKKNNNNNIY